jgi:copper oxidase (laccase) domain-containing protein
MTRCTPPINWLIPDWPAPPGVHALCSLRSGGVSSAPYDSLNLGDHVGDDPAHVAANRLIFRQAIGARPVFLNQVHGQQVLELDAASPNASVADACMTAQPSLACTIMVADCLPVLFSTRDGRWVGAAHAGWRGLAAGILESSCQRLGAAASGHRELAEMTASVGQSAPAKKDAAAGADLLAWLGPCIGPQAFEVGDEVRQVFVAQDAKAAQMFQPQASGKWLADLAGLARQRLTALGVTQVFGNDGSSPWCTVTQDSRFFSHRRDRVSGRFAVSIWRDT